MPESQSGRGQTPLAASLPGHDDRLKDIEGDQQDERYPPNNPDVKLHKKVFQGDSVFLSARQSK